MQRERSLKELEDISGKACEILGKTNDGDLLDPQDLKLLEGAVNNYLSVEGREIFEKLYRSVVVDEVYTKPFLHNIEHLTRDHDGYIYYKGINVEHYDRDYVYTEAAKSKLLELKRQCEFLERKGVPVSGSEVIWGWGKYNDEYSAERAIELGLLLGGAGLMYSRVELYNSGREYIYFACGKPGGLEDIKEHPVTQNMIGRYFDDEYYIKVETFCYGSTPYLQESEVRAEIESVLHSCHEYLQKQGKLSALLPITYKTDFAKGYEYSRQFDRILGGADRSFEYSEVYLRGNGYGDTKLYFIGRPTLDDIKQYHEYRYMFNKFGDELSVSSSTYQYGTGEPIRLGEVNSSAISGLLYDAHYYFEKHELSKETGWEIISNEAKVTRLQNDADISASQYVAESGFEP